MRVIYLGTPAFAVPTLNALIESEEHEVVAVLCQPDRPSGRGKKIQAPPVKELACRHGIPVFQPEKLSKAKEIVESMEALAPDVLVMVAFGQILKKRVLEMAPFGVINLHGSILPRYRGPAPINWAIINGESRSGVTTMKTDAGVDTGAMLLKHEIEISEHTTASELSQTLASIGAPLMMRTLAGLADGSLEAEAQDSEMATYAPLLSRDTGILNWTKDAWQAHNLIRGLQDWPGASTTFRGQPLKLIKSMPIIDDISGEPRKHIELEPGALDTTMEGKVLVACGPCGEQRLELLIVQPPNRGRQNARDWSNGARINSDDRFEFTDSRLEKGGLVKN